MIIPARNAAAHLGACLAALESSGGGLAPAELIVVDDRSADSTAAIAQARGARVVRGMGRGPAAARNAGMRESSCEIVVFLDSDCVPEPGCLEALLAPMVDPLVSGVRGGYSGRQRSRIARFVQLEMEERQALLAATSRVTLIDTACAAYRRRVLERYGGFDERYRFPSVEDAEFSFRIVAGGERLVFAPGARVRHRHPDSIGTYCLRKLRFGYHRAGLYLRYPSRLASDGYTPRLMPFQIALSGMMTAGLLAGTWSRRARLISVVSGLLFLGSALPMCRRAWTSDRGLTASVPLLLFLRSVAQGAGLLLGLFSMVTAESHLLRSLRPRDPEEPCTQSVETPWHP